MKASTGGSAGPSAGLLLQFGPDLGVELLHLGRAGLRRARVAIFRLFRAPRSPSAPFMSAGMKVVRPGDAVGIAVEGRVHAGVLRIHHEVEEQLGVVDVLGILRGRRCCRSTSRSLLSDRRSEWPDWPSRWRMADPFQSLDAAKSPDPIFSIVPYSMATQSGLALTSVSRTFFRISRSPVHFLPPL